MSSELSLSSHATSITTVIHKREHATTDYKLSPESQRLLQTLPEPKSVWNHFLMCAETPRPSADLDRIRARILGFAHTHSLSAKVDKMGNVCIRRPAAPGFEDSVPLIMQAHLDVVCSKEKDSPHDFHKDPVKLRVEGDYLKATGTTLGADNGIGVAAILAVLENPPARHGPLEGLFTADEETTMAGAEFLEQRPFLTGSVLINVDSEQEHEVCIGCAGGFEKYLHLSVDREDVHDKRHTLCQLQLSGLMGGHTGIDIDKNRANALQLIARLITNAFERGYKPRLVSLKGGNAPNAIPRDAQAEVLIPDDFVAAFERDSQRYLEVLKAEFQQAEAREDTPPAAAVQEGEGESPTKKRRTEEKSDGVEQMETDAVDDATAAKLPNFLLQITHSKVESVSACTSHSTRSVLDLMAVLPHGVIRYTDVTKVAQERAVDTSISFSMATLCKQPSDEKAPPVVRELAGTPVVKIEADPDSKKLADPCVFTAHLFSRASAEEQMVQVERKLTALTRLVPGLTASARFNHFPGWAPDLSFPLPQVIAVHERLFHRKPRVYSVHAGLECGLLQGRYPGLKCVSIGPQIDHAHSPDERLRIPSVKPFMDWLVHTIDALAAVNPSRLTHTGLSASP